MRGRRLLLILVLIAGLLLLVVVVLALVLQSGQPEEAEVAVGPVAEGTLAPDITPTPTIPPDVTVVEVVVSLQTVPRGWVMTEAELVLEERLASEVKSNVLTRIEDAVGLYARNQIYQGETITTDSLVRDPTLIGIENYGPSSLVPPGWVAMAVPLDRLSSVAYGLAAGDSVDIMLTFTLNALDQEFQTLLFNSATFFLQEQDVVLAGEATPNIFVIDPYGRFETLATGDVAHIGPSEDTQRPYPVSVILQNARVIHIGTWVPPEPAMPPTPTPEPDAPTPTPGGPPPTPTPSPPDVMLLALPPQQQLFMKYALEVTADIDYALRRFDASLQVQPQNVDLTYLLEQFGIDVPPNAVFAIGGIETTSVEVEEAVQP